jgi:thermopsin
MDPPFPQLDGTMTIATSAGSAMAAMGTVARGRFSGSKASLPAPDGGTSVGDLEEHPGIEEGGLSMAPAPWWTHAVMPAAVVLIVLASSFALGPNAHSLPAAGPMEAGAGLPTSLASPVPHAGPMVSPVPRTGSLRPLAGLGDRPREARLGAAQLLGSRAGDLASASVPLMPAGIGIADYGVLNTTGTATAAPLSTTSWQASITLDSGRLFYAPVAAPDNFSVQLNTFLANVTVHGNSSGTFWVQNTLSYSASSQVLWIVSDMWNATGGLGAPEPLTRATFAGGNGTTGTAFGQDYYVSSGPAIRIAYPFTVTLWLNASVTDRAGSSDPTVRFGYDVAKADEPPRHGVYDTVVFNASTLAGSGEPAATFQVDPLRLAWGYAPEDAEFVVGGAGEGSPAVAYAFDATMELEYLDGSGAYANAPSAWNTGITGESAVGLSAHYDTPGTLELTTGPSFAVPLWNATPGGDAGSATLRGRLAPDNAFLFLVQDADYSVQAPTSWAPTLPGGAFDFTLPPAARYSGEALLSEHDPLWFNATGAAGTTVWENLSLPSDASQGIYTPLFAWNNEQLANLSVSGSGAEADPYVLPNVQTHPISPVFGDLGDYLWDMFPGIQLVGTSAFVTVRDPAPMNLTYPAYLSLLLEEELLPETNQLPIVFADTEHASLWGGSVGGWRPLLSMDGFGDVILWNSTGSVVGDVNFTVRGTGLVLDGGGSGNTVWGNRFTNGPLEPEMQAYNLGVLENEAGDLLYDNYFATQEGAAAPGIALWPWNSFFVRLPIEDRDAWNLSAPAAATAVREVGGFSLTGSVDGGPTVCGNWWSGYDPNSRLPYTDAAWSGWSGLAVLPFADSRIAQGGDACPTGPNGTEAYTVSFTENGLSAGTWQVTLAGQAESAAAGSPIDFAMPNGTWAFVAGADVLGYSVSPSNGTVAIQGSPVAQAFQFTATTTGGPDPRLQYVAVAAALGVVALVVAADLAGRPPSRRPKPTGR